MEIELLKKQMEEYRNEWQRAVESRDKLIQMANQQERRMEQLSGAITALDRLIKETEPKPQEAQNVGNENNPNPEGKIIS